MNELMHRYLDIEKEVNNFYEDDFESESAEYYVNKSLKMKLISLISDAKKDNNIEVMNKSIELLSENTGCVEDVEILNILLEGAGNIKNEILANSPMARWLK